VSPDDMPETTVESDTPQLEGYAKYRHLKANVRRRRAAYVWVMLLALVVLAGAFAYALFSGKDPGQWSGSDFYAPYAIYAVLGVLFLWALLMFFSGKRTVVEEAVMPKDMERTLMQCPECKSVFQYGELHFTDNKRTAFSCPVCGAFGRLPDPMQEPVKVLRPEGEFKQLQYHCTNCNEDIEVGTFGDTPLHLVRFRACPHCGQKGYIERIAASPGNWTPSPEGEGWSP